MNTLSDGMVVARIGQLLELRAQVQITILDTRCNQVCLGITAPQWIPVSFVPGRKLLEAGSTKIGSVQVGEHFAVGRDLTITVLLVTSDNVRLLIGRPQGKVGVRTTGRAHAKRIRRWPTLGHSLTRTIVERRGRRHFYGGAARV